MADIDYTRLGLPASIMQEAQFYPFEDLLIKMFERGLPDLNFSTYISENIQFPAVVGSRFTRSTGWSGDPRFIDSGPVRINVFTEQPNADGKGYFISEAIRVMMMKAHTERWHFPGTGSILSIRMEAEPTDANDWMTASGIVQFADLPKGVSRFETIYYMTVRRPN